MKWIAITLVMIFSLAGSSFAESNAMGSVFGTLSTANALGQGKGNFGFGIGLADNATSFVGSLTYGMSQYTDGRIKIGLADPDHGGDTKFAIGADFKWQYWDATADPKYPFDMALGGFFEYIDFDYASGLQVGGLIMGSHTFVMQRGGSLTPYGRFNARVESISYSRPAGSQGDDSETNLKVGLNAGVQWQMTPTLAFFGEFQLDGNDGLFLGIDWGVM